MNVGCLIRISRGVIVTPLGKICSKKYLGRTRFKDRFLKKMLFKKSKHPSPFPYKTLGSNNSYTLIGKRYLICMYHTCIERCQRVK